MDVAVLVIVIAGGVGAISFVAAGWLRLARQDHARRQRSRCLRARFGDEYERVVSLEGRHEGELVLASRLVLYGDLEYPQLSCYRRETCAEQWSCLEAQFAVAPERALRDAERLVVGVMEARGVWAPEGTRRADALSVTDPPLAESYRRAHGVFCLVEHDGASTEQLVVAMGWYRDLLERLLDRPHGDLDHGGRAVSRTVPAR